MSDADRTQHGRRLAESLRIAAEIAEGDGHSDVRHSPSILPRENLGFAEGVEAMRQARNGATVPAEPQGVSLEEKAQVVHFLPHHIALFRLLNPERSAALGRFVVRLAEGQTVSRWWSGAWKIGVAIVVAVFAAARWGVDQIPLLRDLSHLWKGHGP